MIRFKVSAPGRVLCMALFALTLTASCGDSGVLARQDPVSDDAEDERSIGGKIPILVSTFEPMSGRPQNNSEFIGDLLPEYVKSFEIVPCPSMPIAYDSAPQRLIECFEAHRYVKAVISLGEDSGSLEIERFATNMDDDAYSDNMGVIRNHQVIIPGAPSRYELTLSPANLSRFSLPNGSPVRVKYDETQGGMGNFLGNHTAFKFMHYLKQKGLATPYGFVHVPHAMDPDEGHNPYEIARAIGTLFEKSLKKTLLRR